MNSKIILSLFDYTGAWSKPYRDNGYKVIQIDIKHGIDIMHWKYWELNSMSVKGILASIPCNNYALSGARWFKQKDNNGTTEYSDRLVSKVKDILNYFATVDFWCVENPMSRIHKLHLWLGEIKHKFNPCDYAGYLDNPDLERYNKQTWLWGRFNIPITKRLEPLQKEFPGWTNLGGKSERTKELRSITPSGFAKAFYEVNK